MDLGLADRVYVLTGASRGLGYATAECLVADGARVVLSSRDGDRAAAAAQRLGAGDRAVGVAGDLGDPGTPERLIATAHDRYGRLDGALISVGGPPRSTAAAATDQQWRDAFETIFLGAVRMARAVAAALAGGAPATVATGTAASTISAAGAADGGAGSGPAADGGSGGGAIAFVLSSSARTPIPDLGISNGLRPGLAGVAKDMADEFGPRGIRVVSLLPHRILTDRNRELFAATGDAERAQAEAEAGVPLRRIGAPAEFGRVAAFVLSPAASYLSGLAIPVDGGAVRTL